MRGRSMVEKKTKKAEGIPSATKITSLAREEKSRLMSRSTFDRLPLKGITVRTVKDSPNEYSVILGLRGEESGVLHLKFTGKEIKYSGSEVRYRLVGQHNGKYGPMEHGHVGLPSLSSLIGHCMVELAKEWHLERIERKNDRKMKSKR